MVKQKLYDKRVEKKLTQEELAYQLGMETSSYNRRENGITKISKKEWDKIAKVLEVDFEEIYEPEDGVYVFNNTNSTGNFGKVHNNVFNNFSDFAVETMKKYIDKLEQENQSLKEKIKLLEGE
jgi:transcriptional regulator with XRE-family HTH domain